jgi:hypothetical protein
VLRTGCFERSNLFDGAISVTVQLSTKLRDNVA